MNTTNYRAKKIGGSYQADGTIVSTFATLAGETRHVFEFDQPAGMLHIFGPGQVEIAAGAAAPLVEADERQAFEKLAVRHDWDLAQAHSDGVTRWLSPMTRDLYLAFLEGRAALAAAPVHVQEPIAEIHCQEFHELAMDYRGASFSKAPMAYKSLCEYIKRLVAPVQPVAVPDGPYTFPIGEDGEYMILDKDGQQVGTVLYYHAAKVIAAALAAPAAQGDAHKSPASFSDHIRWVIAGVRNGHGADDVAINNMRAWHESKVKASKAPVADKKSIRYDFLRLDDQQYYVAFRDQFGAFRQIREKELDKTIDAAIAAKAAS